MTEPPLSDLMQRVLVAVLDARILKRYPPTPNEIGYRLKLPRVTRARGRAPGTMGEAQRVITPLRRLEERGLVCLRGRRDGRSGTAYGFTADGLVKAGELREAGVRADKPVSLPSGTRAEE